MLAAIHVSPEAACGGAIGRLRDGDIVHLDAEAGTMQAEVDASEWAARTSAPLDLAANHVGVGRELFGLMRVQVGSAEQGGCALFVNEAAVNEAALDGTGEH